ncbi:MAG TPA: hypothetical protein VGV88_12635 [Candidatus Dormibacteraeota bacterium]|nr:hypothetical protein [Candidatus Dormibacteraeota bacterium]
MRKARVTRLLSTAGAVVAAVLFTNAPVVAGQASDWSLGYFTPSTHGAISNSSVAALAGGVATFDFTNQPNTALLVTSHGAFKGTLLGNDQGKTITATFTVSGASAFTYFGQGDPNVNPCVFPANVRLYFETSNAGGFAFTDFWWSDTAAAVLANGTVTITASVLSTGWSDWNGQPAAGNVDAFNQAASNVTLIGLSFGGGCFFANGVGTVDGSGTFDLDSFSVS